MPDDKLLHVGVKRKSGRYPWGSGDEPFQSSPFLGKYENLLSKGLNGTQIAAELGMTTGELRDNITWARREEKTYLQGRMKEDQAAGMSNVAIGNKYKVSEGTVRNYLSEKTHNHEQIQAETITKALVDGVDKTGYLDVGVGVELQLGIPRTKFNNAVNELVEKEGYNIHNIYVRRLGNRDKPITAKVLTKESDLEIVKKDYDKIRPLEAWSEDGGETVVNLKPPKSLDMDKIQIRYKEDGGAEMDGLIQMRPGVDDLDMGASHYAQVRIKAGKDRYIKGMAVYGDLKDFPEGIDVIFNTNKEKGTPKDKVLKPLKEDTDNIFGSTIVRQNKSKMLNIVNEEGEWDTWSTSLSSQFLSKQPANLIKERLAETYSNLTKEFQEIAGLTNPIVREYLMTNYANGLISKVKKLSAAGLPKTKSHVILPFPDMNPNEIYAPNYKDGDRVVLLRYPHGGVFELPEVTVNNKHPRAKSVLGNAPDAIGIHHSVAEKLSGADFDGDTVYVIPNNSGRIKTERALKELKNFDPMMYKVDHDTITSSAKQKQMGDVSNLITDMTIKKASNSEIARAVKHSMVVIDSEKHKLDYKQSARDNRISELKKKYQTHINPDTGKESKGASTLISRSKRKLYPDMDDDDKATIKKQRTKVYNTFDDVDASKYSSGTQVESIYVDYVKKVQGLRKSAGTIVESTVPPKYDSSAAKVYKTEVDSLNKKLNIAKLNAPRERQAQILSNKLYYSNVNMDMDKDQKKKLRVRSVTRARETVGANRMIKNEEGKRVKENVLDVSPKEWEAIEARAVSSSKVKEVLRYANEDQIRKYATPRQNKLSSAKATRAQSMLNKGLTYAEVAESLGISTSAVRTILDGN